MKKTKKKVENKKENRMRGVSLVEPKKEKNRKEIRNEGIFAREHEEGE